MIAISRRKHSKIERELPPEIREAVNAKLTEGYTYKEVTDWLNQMGHAIGKSSVARYGRDFLARLERLKVVKEQARAIVQETGDGPATEMHEAANQLAVQAIMEILMRTPSLEGERVADLLKALAQLERSAVNREKLKFEFRSKAESVITTIQDDDLAGKSPAEIRELIRVRIKEEYGA